MTRIENCFIKLNVDCTMASGWLERLVRLAEQSRAVTGLDQRHPDFGEFVFYLFFRGSSLGLRKVTPAGPVKVTWTITSVFSVHV